MRSSIALLLLLSSVALAEDPVLPKEALDRVLAATVFIRCTYAETTAPDAPVAVVSSGSGFIVADTGLVVTNNHVVAATLEYKDRPYVLRDIAVHVNCGSKNRKEYRASVLAAYELPVDLALLRIRADLRFPTLETDSLWADNNEVALTEHVWAIGFPLGEAMEDALADVHMTKNPDGPDISIREGSISALRKDAEGKVKAIEHGCNIEHGNSGGPLVNRKGFVVGINALGIEKTAFAIPLWRAKELFGTTILWTSESQKVSSADRRLLRVDANAEPSATTFKTIEEAFAATHAGDTVELAAGVYQLTKPLRISGLAWVRGAGAGRTRIIAADDSWLGVEVGAGGNYTELSDMTISSRSGTALAVRETASPQTYLHDLVLDGTLDRTLLTEPGAAPQIVACRITGGVRVKGPGGRSRFLRCDLPTVNLAGGTAELEGCTLGGTTGIVADGGELDVSHTLIPAGSLKSTKATLRNCRFNSPGALMFGEFRAEGTSDVEMSGGSTRLAIVFDGAGVKATVTGTSFSSEGSPALEVVNGAAVVLKSSSFHLGRGVQALSAEQAARTVFGIRVAGEACRVTLSGCSFTSTQGGVAISLVGGAQVEPGDTQYAGVTTEIGRE